MVLPSAFCILSVLSFPNWKHWGIYAGLREALESDLGSNKATKLERETPSPLPKPSGDRKGKSDGSEVLLLF